MGLQISITRNTPNRAHRNGKWVSRWSNPPPRNRAEWLEYFNKSPRLSVVDRIGSDLAYVNGRLFEVDSSGNEREIKQHPFLTFMKKPNPLFEFTPAALWRLQQVYLDITGEGGMVIERDERGIPIELWPIPTNWIMETPYLNHPRYKVREPGGGIIEVPVEDMFMQRTLDPIDPYRRGIGKSESIADEIEIDEYASKFQKRFFFNDATPSLVISMPGSDPDQRDRFVAQWKQRFRGMFNSHGVAAIDGDATINKVSESMKDMDMVEGRRYLRDAALEHFNVPREIMGITESSNRATSEAAQYIYAQYVLTPRLKEREDAINLQLLPFFGENLVWHYDDIVPHDKEFDKMSAIENWNAGLITKNQALEMQNMATIGPAGDIYKTDMASIYYGKEENPTEITTAVSQPAFDFGELKFDVKPTERKSSNGDNLSAKPTDDNDVINIYASSVLTGAASNVLDERVEGAVYRTLEATSKNVEAKFGRELQKYFTRQSEMIQRALIEKSTEIDNLVTDADIVQYVNSLIDWNSESKVLQSIMTPVWKNGLNSGRDYIINHFGGRADLIMPDINVLNPHARVSGIINTTRQKIASSIQRVNSDGGSVENVISQIGDNIGNNSSRVNSIAQNESRTAVSTGEFVAAKNNGFDGKRWVSHADEKTRPSHRRINGEIRPIDEPFSNGLMIPNDPNGPLEEIMGCRCKWIPVMLKPGNNNSF